MEQFWYQNEDSRIRLVVLNILVFLIYVGTGKLSLLLATSNASSSSIWAPTGIAIAAFLLMGKKIWPAIFLGAFMVNVTTSGTIAPSIGIAFGNMLEGLTAAYVMRRWTGGEKTFENPSNVFRFVAFAALLCTMISATIGVTVLAVSGLAEWSNFLPVWFTWWIGDVGGAVLVAPLLIVWNQPPKPVRSHWRILETVAIVPILGFVTWFVFGGAPLFFQDGAPIQFLLWPCLVWAALRFGAYGTTAASAFVAIIAIYETVSGNGPFVSVERNQILPLLQTYLATMSIVMLFVAASVMRLRNTLDGLVANPMAKQIGFDGRRY